MNKVYLITVVFILIVCINCKSPFFTSDEDIEKVFISPIEFQKYFRNDKLLGLPKIYAIDLSRYNTSKARHRFNDSIEGIKNKICNSKPTIGPPDDSDKHSIFFIYSFQDSSFLPNQNSSKNILIPYGYNYFYFKPFDNFRDEEISLGCEREDIIHIPDYPHQPGDFTDEVTLKKLEPLIIKTFDKHFNKFFKTFPVKKYSTLPVVQLIDTLKTIKYRQLSFYLLRNEDTTTTLQHVIKALINNYLRCLRKSILTHLKKSFNELNPSEILLLYNFIGLRIDIEPENMEYMGYPAQPGFHFHKKLNIDKVFFKNIDIRCIAKSGDYLWACSDSAVYKAHIKDSIFTLMKGHLFHCHDIKIDLKGTIWVATNDGVYKYGNMVWDKYDTLNSGIGNNVMLKLAIDKYNRVWGAGERFYGFNGPEIGIRLSVYDQAYQKWFTYNPYSLLLKEWSLGDMKIDKNQVVWILPIFTRTDYSPPIRKTDVILLQNDNFRTLKLLQDRDFSCRPEYSSIQFDKDGNCLLAADHWITELDHEAFYQDNRAQRNWINSCGRGGCLSELVVDKRNNRWLLVGNGLNKYQNLNWFRIDIDESILPEEVINKIDIDYDENVMWLSTANGVLQCLLDKN